MAGSLNHIIDGDGALTLQFVENGRLEALEECFDLVAVLCDGDLVKLRQACGRLGIPVPATVPLAGKRAYRLAKNEPRKKGEKR